MPRPFPEVASSILPDAGGKSSKFFPPCLPIFFGKSFLPARTSLPAGSGPVPSRKKGETMNSTRSRPRGLLVGLGLALAALAGCQTEFGGMTLPSPHYLEHPPTYIPPSPPYPYPRELSTQQAIAAQAEPGAPLGLPPRVPGGPFGPGGTGGP